MVGDGVEPVLELVPQTAERPAKEATAGQSAARRMVGEVGGDGGWRWAPVGPGAAGKVWRVSGESVEPK